MSVLGRILICKKDAEAMVVFYGGRLGLWSCGMIYKHLSTKVRRCLKSRLSQMSPQAISSCEYFIHLRPNDK